MSATRMTPAPLYPGVGGRGWRWVWAAVVVCAGLVGCGAPEVGSAVPAPGCSNTFDDAAIRADRVAVPYLDAARGSCVPLTATDLIKVGEWVCATSTAGASEQGAISVVRQMEPALTEVQAGAVVASARGQFCPALGNRSYLQAVQVGG
jgi:hypothetical protein